MSALVAIACAALACAAGMGAWAATSGEGLRGLAALRARLAARARLRTVLQRRPRGLPGRPVRAMGGRLREGRARRRERDRVLEELPELIDVVSLGLSAGISFDAALGIYCDKYATVLSSLLRDAMHSWQLGLSTRREALGALARRLGVPAFTTFVDTVGESLAFGAPLSKVLAQQAQAVREERRMRAQERIEKAPVKMLVPTGTLILPAMLLCVLGPLLASLASLTG